MYSSNGHANEDFVWQSPVVAKSTAARQDYGVRSLSEPTYSACRRDDMSGRTVNEGGSIARSREPRRTGPKPCCTVIPVDEILSDLFS
ncbi:MAG: hypothetical protein QOH31_309 [Verrucomicrobiota bacterium]|jgi:hypothetical protein